MTNTMRDRFEEWYKKLPVLERVKAAEELLVFDGYTAPQATAKAILRNILTELEAIMRGKDHASNK